MGIFEAIIQGIVQGLTEFLPVSSSGHLLISQHILGVKECNLFFSVMLHIGTLIAVLAVYWKEVWNLTISFFGMIKKIFKREFSLKKMDFYEQMVLMIIVGLLPLFLLFLPVFGTGMTVKEIAQELSNENNIILVGISLLITSYLLNRGTNIERRKKISSLGLNKEENLEGNKRIGFMDAISIGVMQFIAAIFPGISRSGSTLSVGLFRGISKKTALDYSFILGIPAIIAAAFLETKEAFEQNLISLIDPISLLVGMVVSCIVGFLAIKLFKWLLKTDKMKIFVIYTFIVGFLAVGIGIFEIFKGYNIFTGV